MVGTRFLYLYALFENDDIPQYRKLEGFQRYYEIRDDRTFVEVTVMNGKINSTVITATQFPEMLRIKDMLNQEWNYRIMEDVEIELYFGKDKP